MKEPDSILPRAIFIGGTDTGVGKTVVSASLLAFLHRKGIRAGYQKWVSTGSRESSEDAALCRKLAPEAFQAESDLHVPYRFALPASPHLAAELEKAAIDTGLLKSSFYKLGQYFPTLVIEGVGGMLVPLTRQLLLADMVAELRLPTLLVCRSGLGTINHSLLSIEACRKRNIPLLGLVFKDEAIRLDEQIVTDNMEIIAALGRIRILGRLPYAPTVDAAVEHFYPLGEGFLKLFS